MIELNIEKIVERNMDLLLFSTILAYLAIVIGTVISLTKLIAMHKFQDTERSNYASGFVSIITSLIWLLYAVVLNSTPLILSSITDIVFDIIIICYTFFIIKTSK